MKGYPFKPIYEYGMYKTNNVYYVPEHDYMFLIYHICYEPYIASGHHPVAWCESINEKGEAHNFTAVIPRKVNSSIKVKHLGEL